MVIIKTQITNITSSICQAIVAGILIKNKFSLSDYNKPKINSYRTKLQKLLDLLEEIIGKYKEDWAAEVSWTYPKGGFFVSLKVPFEFGRDQVVECVNMYGIILCPMQFFYQDSGGEKEIRLAFSNLSYEVMEKGINKLQKYLKHKIVNEA